MDQLLHTLLTLVLVYGYPIIIIAIILAYLGIPISLNAILLAAGSFTVNGTLSIYILIPLVTIASVLGDLGEYYIGRRFGFVIVDRFTSKIGLTHARIANTNVFLQRWGSITVFITRWLLTPFGIPVNLMAGISEYPFSRFLIAASTGELLWASLYIYLGNYFGANWQIFFDYINNAPVLLALLTIGIISLVVAFRMWKSHT